MKKFRFRLQRILEFRIAEKKDRERELAAKNHQLQQAELKLEEIKEEQERATLSEETILTAAELMLKSTYRERLREALVEQRLLILEAAKAVDEAKDAYIEKAIETETLENVKGKRLADHKEEERRAGRKDIDEMVVQRFRFRKNSGS